MAGLLDFDDPQQAGLLAFAQNMFAAGAPQTRRVGIGQALTSGLSGMQQAQQTMLQQQQANEIAQQAQQAAIQNQYLGPQLQQKLMESQLANQKLLATLPAAAPQAWAQVGLTQGEASEAAQRGNLFGSQANLISGQSPALIQQSYADMYSDPAVRRAMQISMSTGMPVAQLLSGFTGGAPSVPSSTTSQNVLGQSPNTITNLPVQQQLQNAVNKPILPGGISSAQQPQIQQTLLTMQTMRATHLALVVQT